MVRVIVGNINSRIAGPLPDDIHIKLKGFLSYRHPDAYFMKSYQEKRWDGVINLYNQNQGQSFYSGLASIACRVLRDNNIAYKIVDARKRPSVNMPNLSFVPPPNFEERDYQIASVERSLKAERGIIKAATGSGKTTMASQIISGVKRSPCMFYVLTKDLMSQAYEDLSETLNVPIGRIGGGKFDIQDINVCMVQTVVRALHHGDHKFHISDYKMDDEDHSFDDADIKSYDKIKAIRKLVGETKVIILDECHHSAARTVTDVLNASPNAYWRYGCSATPYREDNAEIVIQGVFGKKIVDISATYLINNGFLLTPYILFEPVYHDVPFHSYQKIYSQCVANNEGFNRHIANTARHLTSKGLSCLILVKQYNHGEMIQSFLDDVDFVDGRMSQKKRDKAIAKLKKREKMCMIATNLADEGLDIPSLDSALLAGGGASSTRVFQRVGRTLRPDRTSSNPRDRSLVVYYEHNVKHLSKHAKKAKRILKQESAFKLLKSNGADYILGEIDEVMGTGPKAPSVWDAL